MDLRRLGVRSVYGGAKEGLRWWIFRLVGSTRYVRSLGSEMTFDRDFKLAARSWVKLRKNESLEPC